ncbi:MAG: hypothetical protein PHT07_21120 [Paludibacter sp.]|nr:hypothetical protein [Paludibacter sp.]
METKHTPSPWFAVDYAGSICIQSGPMYEDLDLLCYDSIFSDIVPPSKEVVEANAKLMATAPELLEALKILLREFDNLIDHVVDMGFIDFEDESIDGVKDAENAKNEAISAIKKATE